MAGLYVYGLTSKPRTLRIRGLFNRPVRVIPLSRLFAIVEIAPRAARPTIANLRAHSRVVAALVASDVDVLPARFGTFAASRVELGRLVGAQRTALARALKLIHGRVQMTVRVRLTGNSEAMDPRRPSGTAYLRSKWAHARRPGRDPLLRAIQRAAQPFASMSRVDWRDGDPPMATLHHLISRSQIVRYEEAVGRAVYVHRAEAAMTGPWAPFAFAEAV